MTISSKEVWTEQRVERLKTLWAAGMSAAQIAADLKCFDHCDDLGRSAVIGKIHRLKLPEPVGKMMRRQPNAERAPAPRATSPKRPEPLQRRNPSNSIATKVAIAAA